MFFCEESLRKINEKDVELFRNGSVHESVDYFETKKYFRRRKKENLYEQNFDGEANRSGVVNFHCMQTSCDEHAVYFRRWLKRRTTFIAFLLFCSRIEALDFRVFTQAYSINSETNRRIRYKN